jgi:RNA-directed DNA polymerase
VKGQTDPVDRPHQPIRGSYASEGTETRCDAGKEAENRSAARVDGLETGFPQAIKESPRQHTNLFEQVLEPENLKAAWRKVRGNKGAPGIDGVSIEDFPELIRKHWGTILAKLKAGTYQPSPARRKVIPKPNGGQRNLNIPTVLDRLLQQAISQVLTPIFERHFSDSSYGYRPLRSVRCAVEKQLKYSREIGKACHVVDCDLKSYFDTIPQARLMKRLRERIADEQLLGLIHKFLKSGTILMTGAYEDTEEGVPQGGPLSPLLSNIVLDEFDKELEARGRRFVRFADDFVILCGSQRAGSRILANVIRFLEDRMKLTVNRMKSSVRTLRETDFLGFCIQQNKVHWSAKSEKRFKDKVRAIVKRTRGVSASRVTAELRQYIRGAVNFYAFAMPFRFAREIDGWIRCHVRCYYWKQWKRPRTRRRNLLRLGIPRHEVHKATRSRKGPWRMSHNTIVHRAMNNEWLKQQGVPSVKEQWQSIRYPKPTPS